MTKFLLLVLLIPFGEAQRCKAEMNCTQCTTHSCFYVEHANLNFCMEGAFGFEKPVKFLTSPDECPSTNTTSTFPPSLSTTAPPLSTSPVPPPSPQHPSSDNSPTLNIITGQMTGCIIIILIIIIVISTVAATYYLKKNNTARENRFARFRVNEADAVSRF